MVTKVLLVFVGIVAIAALAGTGFLFMQNKQLMEQMASQNKPVVIETENSNDQPPVDVDVIVSDDSAEPTPTPPPAPQPPVVFTPGGAFNNTLRAELMAKIVNPFIDYYVNDPYVQIASIEIEENTQESKVTYPYLFTALSKNGGSQGFVIRLPIDWWIPECMGSCPFTDSFKTKYPEIVKKSNQ